MRVVDCIWWLTCCAGYNLYLLLSCTYYVLFRRSLIPFLSGLTLGILDVLSRTLLLTSMMGVNLPSRERSKAHKMVEK